MANDRPRIPADIRRRVLVEAGHRCAIPTCRHIEVDVHHIISWETCHRHEYDNLIALCPSCHQRADRGDIDRKSLKLYKSNLRFTHDKFSQVEVDILFELYKAPEGTSVQWPPFMHIFINRIVEAGYISIQKSFNNTFYVSMQISPDYLSITKEGRGFVNDLGVQEL